MAQPKPPKHPKDRIKTEPGFEKRLADMYKKVLHTPPPRKQIDQVKSPRKTRP